MAADDDVLTFQTDTLSIGTTDGSTTVTGDFTAEFVDRQVDAVGVPSGARVVSVSVGVSAVLSIAATATATVSAELTEQEFHAAAGGLPSGWTQDAGDPANVVSNSGSLDLGGGSLTAASLAVAAVSIGANIETGGSDLNLGAGNINMPDGGQIVLGDAAWSSSQLTTWGADLKTRGGDFSTSGGSGTGNAAIKGALGVNGATPNTPEVPAIATPQDIVDALVALGLVTQAS